MFSLYNSLNKYYLSIVEWLMGSCVFDFIFLFHAGVVSFMNNTLDGIQGMLGNISDTGCLKKIQRPVFLVIDAASDVELTNKF